jgi:hypothetical protein
VDAFTRERVSELRNEIAWLRRENELYRTQKRRTVMQAKEHGARRFRLMTIREELLKLTALPRGKPWY